MSTQVSDVHNSRSCVCGSTWPTTLRVCVHRNGFSRRAVSMLGLASGFPNLRTGLTWFKEQAILRAIEVPDVVTVGSPQDTMDEMCKLNYGVKARRGRHKSPLVPRGILQISVTGKPCQYTPRILIPVLLCFWTTSLTITVANACTTSWVELKLCHWVHMLWPD